MGRKNKQNPFAAKKREKRNGDLMNIPAEKRSEAYPEIIRDNPYFIKYYKAQKICQDEEEWDAFLNAIRDNLPVTFRITGYKEEAKAFLKIIEDDLFEDYISGVAELYKIPKDKVNRPYCLPWYPNKLAYQLQLTRKDIRRSEALFRLHNFLIVETNAGSISRQETVSMIPPIVLDVKPTDKVLDMCAAPGSKTAQLIEALHSRPDLYKIPPGFLVANDVDNNRCYMLVHQAKRLNSPCFVVTNHDSAFFPNLMTSDVDSSKKVLKFNKILCDVPCSGDGTLRKNPDIWNKWHLGQAYNLHGIQYRILRRGTELLEVGGRLVYSTCSLNPIENEAVLQRIITESEGALEIVDASSLVPGLKYKPGMTYWIVANKEVQELYYKFEEVPEKYHTIIRPSMFPFPEEKIKKIGLEKCLRILPHLQNSGGFFVALIEKKRRLSFEKREDQVNNISETNIVLNVNSSEGPPVPWGPQRKKRRLHGYKEDPYIFFKTDDPDWGDIKEFFSLDDTFNGNCLLTRCESNKKRNIYFCSEPIKDLVQLNESIIKIINTGVKTFARCENRISNHLFRLAQEGLFTTNNFIGNKRRININRDDLILLLNCTDPTKPPSITTLSEDTQRRWTELDVGSCILNYSGQTFDLFTVGWRGKSSLRAYVDKNETVHILRLLGADLTKFQVNKFEKVKAEKNEHELDV